MSKKNENKLDAGEIPLMILTNERTPFKAKQILMLYKAASLAQLAYMDGMDPETGEIQPLLVGLEPTEDGKFNVYPLAALFSNIDGIPQYLVPDGHGSYIDYRTPEHRAEPDVPCAGAVGGEDAVELTTIHGEEEGTTKEGDAGANPDGGTLGGSPPEAV